jgi:hypothetical protein
MSVIKNDIEYSLNLKSNVSIMCVKLSCPKSGTKFIYLLLFCFHMVDKLNDRHEMTLLLIQESLWKVEDKLNIVLESIADHEAELIRLKRLTDLSLQRLAKIETRRLRKNKEGHNYG